MAFMPWKFLCQFLGKPLDGSGHIRYLDDLELDLEIADFSNPLGLPATSAFRARRI